MSDPSGSSLFHVNGEGTQKTVEGGRGVNPDWPCDQKMSLSSSKGYPSHIDASRVITWLKPVKETRTDALWSKYSFPPNVRVFFPLLGPQFVVGTEEDRGMMNFIYWLEVHINNGLRFPLHAIFSITPVFIPSTHM